MKHSSQPAAVIAGPGSVFFTQDSFSNVKTLVQLWISELGGGGVTPESVMSIIGAMPTKPEVHFVPRSQHFSFVAPCSAEFMQSGREICIDGPNFDRISFHKEFKAEVLAFFRKHLTDTGNPR